MSLTKLNTKQTKGKQKTLPKLKTVLANPYKKKCPTLDDHEMLQLQHILHAAVKKSEQKPSVFATENQICLGLESSLRQINNSHCSCVFISLNIKPRFLISLIAQNAEAKNLTAPVYVQPQLEEFTAAVFGMRALVLVLPKEYMHFGTGLTTWIAAHKKETKVAAVKETKQPILKRKPKLKQNLKENCNEAAKDLPTFSKKAKDHLWTGDFISFTDSSENIKSGKSNLDEDKNHLFSALDKMAKKATESQEIIEVKETVLYEKIIADDFDTIPKDSASEFDCYSDDFLQEYQPLTVHHILPNPNKKRKKKQKK